MLSACCASEQQYFVRRKYYPLRVRATSGDVRVRHARPRSGGPQLGMCGSGTHRPGNGRPQLGMCWSGMHRPSRGPSRPDLVISLADLCSDRTRPPRMDHLRSLRGRCVRRPHKRRERWASEGHPAGRTNAANAGPPKATAPQRNGPLTARPPRPGRLQPRRPARLAGTRETHRLSRPQRPHPTGQGRHGTHPGPGSRPPTARRRHRLPHR